MTRIESLSLPGVLTAIGADRIAPYRVATDGSSTAALRLYCWNIEASTALLGAYAVMEVGVRNAMHEALAAALGDPRWWDSAPLRPHEREQVDEAAARLDGHGIAWTAGHLVAELRASFWESLERLRRLRNRAAHHEPIHARDLAVDHRYLCEVAGFVGPDLRTWITTHSRLPRVIARRDDVVAGRVPAAF